MCRRPSGRGTGLLVAALSVACGAEVKQPVEYNHRLHVGELGLTCDTCHATAASGEVAGLPPLSTCATCHEEASGTSAEAMKVQEAVRSGREIAWVRLHELPRHVFFTHRRHVAVARLPCERCHGAMRDQARPPPAPLVALGMADCVDCHRQLGARLDCAACHR